MRILFVTYRFPHPTVNHAGGVYLFNIIKALYEKGFTIDLLSFINDDEYQYVSQMHKYCKTIELVSSRKSVCESILDLPSYFLKPRFIITVFQRRLVRKLIQLQNINIYSVIQFEWTPMCQYVNYVKKGTVKLLTEVDVSIIPIEREYLRQTLLLQKLKKWWTLKLLKKYELKFCTKFDLVLTLSKKDADFLNRLDPQIKTFSYPLFVKTTDEILEPRLNKKILFFAHLGRPLNIEAAEWFYENVFVDINRAHHDTIFVIVGAEPHERIYKIAENRNVQLFANVDNLDDFYDDARVFVSPLFVGGGVIKKNLDAMGLGCPLITTTIGNEGIGGLDGRDVLIANSKEEFVSKLNLILTDDNYWRMLSTNSSKFIRDNYNFSLSIDKLINKYNSMVNEYLK
jgi:glycosyltransferase involved in cell wall biosynthesis